NENVSGGGINFAQRVMDCGDAGHILLSDNIAGQLIQVGAWPIHDLGMCEVKHGERVHLFNLHTEEIGNPELPARLRTGFPGLDRIPGTRSHSPPAAERIPAQPPEEALPMPAARQVRVALLYKR